MMSKTHLSIGIATSLLIIHPNEYKECILAIIGGSIGGVIADSDILKNDYKKDALIGQLSALFVTLILLFIDYLFGLGIVSNILINKNSSIIGLIILIGIYLYGFFSEHRTFTHSLLAILIYTIPISIICYELTFPFIYGYLSHLFLDILNKKKVPIFYPAKGGICFNLCYASKTANKVIMNIGFILSIFLIIISLIRIV